jgi:hypothetical protein
MPSALTAGRPARHHSIPFTARTDRRYSPETLWPPDPARLVAVRGIRGTTIGHTQLGRAAGEPRGTGTGRGHGILAQRDPGRSE